MDWKWTCGSCTASFGHEDELREHRMAAHPELHAGRIAADAAYAVTGDEDEAQAAFDKAVAEYKAAAR